jgi:hypothetical protein
MGKNTKKIFGPLKNGNMISITISMAKFFWSIGPHPYRNQMT